MSKQIGLLRAGVTVLASTAFVATWSSGFLVAAIATVDVSPLTLLVWRFVPLAGVLLVLALATGSVRRVGAAGLRRQSVIGLFAQFGYCVFVYAAIAAGVATGTVALIDAVQPLVVAVLVGPLLGLRVRGAQWAGLLVGAAGVLLVVRSQLEGSGAPPAVYVLPVLAMSCLIAATFLQRRADAHAGVLTTLTIHVVVSAAALVVVTAATGTLAPPVSPSFWFAAAFAAVVPTLAAYGLYWWLLRRVGITALNALLFLIAPATAAAGAALLDERLTATTLVGFVLCAIGVAVVLASESAAGSASAARSRAAGSEDDPAEGARGRTAGVPPRPAARAAGG
ncbi:DMT family transporter [Oerskovia jenensis]|uniref:DMT family transporter n=1 Tax=Oerskovia jenensis TaxID=162169 RepID=UPI0036DDFF78